MSSSQFKLFITGSTGLLGTNLVRDALKRGWPVKALARDPHKAQRVLPPHDHLEIIQGELDHFDQWHAELDGCQALVHGAAYFREYFDHGDHEAKLTRYNVEFPVKLMASAQKAGVSRIVMVSSSGVLGPPRDGKLADEATPPSGIALRNLYFFSKVQMEQALRQQPGADRIAIARPGWMFGPHDSAPTAAGAFARDLVQGKKVQLPTGQPFGIVDARDVSAAILQIIDHNKTGIFNLTGHNMRAIEALRAVAEAAGKGQVQSVPYGMALTMGTILNPITRALNKPNPIPIEGLKSLIGGIPVSTAKAELALGLKWRPFSETAQAVVDYWQRELAQV